MHACMYVHVYTVYTHVHILMCVCVHRLLHSCTKSFCFVPRRFSWGSVGKVFSLPCIAGAQHAWTEPEASPPMWTGSKTRHVSMTKKGFPSADRAFSGPSAARIEIPRARDVEAKALLTHLVYPLPHRGLKERPLPQWGFMGPCGGASSGPETRGTNEASRRAENTLTGHTWLFLLLLDKASSRRAGIARVCLRLCVLSVACFSSRQHPSNSQGCAGFAWASALGGLPALHGLNALRLHFSSLFRAVCSLFCTSLVSFERFNSLVSFERCAPCSAIL